jgi:uncharacterized protein YndB with AHSA1/START domain
MKKEALRAVTVIPVAPTTLYLAWLDSEQHSAMTGSPAKIDGQVGSKFSTWNNYITGKLITLDLGRRIIMSWRTTEFPRDASDSRVEIHFEALGGNTRVTILHTEIPEGQAETYKAGWNEHYFAPMRAHFSKYLPDPRKPPPPRRPPPPPEDEEPEEETAAPAPKSKGKKAPPPPPSKGPGVAKTSAAKSAGAKSRSAGGQAPASKAPAKPSAKPAAKAKRAAKPAPKKPAPAKKPAKPAAKKPAPKKAGKPAAKAKPSKKPAPKKKKR